MYTHHYQPLITSKGKLINASYMHASGSRVMDKCIIGMCIMVTCIRINNICIAHAYNHEGQESYIYACNRDKDREKLINASYMHISGSWVMDKCIIGMCIMVTCIRIKKDRGTLTNASLGSRIIHTIDESYTHGLGPMIRDTCLLYTCIRVNVQR